MKTGKKLLPIKEREKARVIQTWIVLADSKARENGAGKPKVNGETNKKRKAQNSRMTLKNQFSLTVFFFSHSKLNTHDTDFFSKHFHPLMSLLRKQ